MVVRNDNAMAVTHAFRRAGKIFIVTIVDDPDVHDHVHVHTGEMSEDAFSVFSNGGPPPLARQGRIVTYKKEDAWVMIAGYMREYEYVACI